MFGGERIFQADPHWKDNVLFYEYFHGDNGAGIGASHQTGWTALVAKLVQKMTSTPKATKASLKTTEPAVVERDAASVVEAVS